MAITGFSAVLYYGIFASITGGYVPYRVKNWWLVVFHLYLFLSFIILPLIVALAAVDHWLGWTLYGVVICATFLVIKIINFHLHKALDMNPEEDEDEGGEKTGGEEEEKEGEGVNEEEKVEKGASEEEEGERKELGLDGKLVEQLLPGQVAVEVGEKREGEEEERLNNHRDSASTLGQSSTYQSSQETAELQLVSSGTRADEEEEERREGGATAVESLLGMIEAEVEVRLGNQGGDSPPGTAKSDDALVIRVDTSSGTEPGLKQGSDGAEKTDENMETEGGSLSQPPRSGVLSGLPHSAEWLQHSNSSIGLMSPMHHSSTSPLQSSRNVQSYFSAMHPGIAGGSRSNTLTVRPSGLQRSVSLPLSRERTPPVLNQTASEVAGNMEGEPVVLLRSSPMREEPGSSAVELEPPTFAYRRRGALRTRRAFSQEVPHLSPYFRPRNQSAGAVSSAAGVHRAGMLSGSETTRVTLDEEEEERDEEKTKGAEDEDEPNPLVESVKHKLLEQGHLSLLDVVEKMPTTLHESIVTDNVSRSCLETITGRVPELQLGHLAHSDGDSSRGAIHWFEVSGEWNFYVFRSDQEPDEEEEEEEEPEIPHRVDSDLFMDRMYQEMLSRYGLDVYNLYPMSDERAQHIIDEALESCSLDMRNLVAVITGLMGSGKTWLLSRLFNQLPPEFYTSTGVAEQSLRGLLHHIINISSSSSWEPFSGMEILKFLASVFPRKPLPPLESIASKVSVATTALSTSTQSSTIQSMVRLVKAPKSSQKLSMLELVHMIDTGGQPELLENLPSLIHHSHLAILVLNLMFGLDEHPSIDYHEEGEAYKRSLPSQYSNRQIIQKLASTLQAKRFSQQKGQCCQLLVVATHRDCVPEGELPARVKAFDQALRAVLLPSNNEELICFSANQIPFILNLKDPDDDDMEGLDLIRSKVSESEAGEVVKTPGSFLVFEQELMEFAIQTVDRDILSLDECLMIGERLKMKPEVVEAALIFFHRQFTLLYFRHILPNLVFTRPQTPLECINAVVRFSYKVGSGEVKGVTEKLVSSLRDGIITEDILSHKQLTQCFIPGLYEPRDAMDLLCHTLTLAPLSREIQSTSDASPATTDLPGPRVKREKREYLMMSLRSAIPDKDIPQHLPPPSEIAPLVVQFTNNCVPLSCFSRTISCLMAVYDWKLSRADDGSPQCLAHNVVSLYKPHAPGQIVLVDTGYSFQIHLHVDGDTDPSSLSKLCFQVRETIFAAINQVFDLLELAKIEVTPAFLCPCPRRPLPHTASVYRFESQWLLHCSVGEKNAGAAQIRHKVWLDAPYVEQEKPSLPKLLRLKIPQKVGANYMQFGILLLNDEDGTLVEGLRCEYQGRCEGVVRGILMEWVRGKGSAVTWKTLTDTLRDCDCAALADHIASTNL